MKVNSAPSRTEQHTVHVETYFIFVQFTQIVTLIMRPSSLGGGRIMRRTLSIRLSVRPSRYRY